MRFDIAVVVFAFGRAFFRCRIKERALQFLSIGCAASGFWKAEQHKWIFQLLAPNPAYRLPRGVLVMMLVWLVICMSGLVSMIGFGQIANAAHVSGLLIGCFTGLLGGLYNRRKLAA